MTRDQPEPPTRESIDAAKAAQRIERDRITQLTGVRITDDGRIVWEGKQP